VTTDSSSVEVDSASTTVGSITPLASETRITDAACAKFPVSETEDTDEDSSGDEILLVRTDCSTDAVISNELVDEETDVLAAGASNDFDVLSVANIPLFELDSTESSSDVDLSTVPLTVPLLEDSIDPSEDDAEDDAIRAVAIDIVCIELSDAAEIVEDSSLNDDEDVFTGSSTASVDC
jgi:hypothetical protein